MGGGVKWAQKHHAETNLNFAHREMIHCLKMPYSCYQSSPEFCMIRISVPAMYPSMIFYLSEHTEPPMR